MQEITNGCQNIADLDSILPDVIYGVIIHDLSTYGPDCANCQKIQTTVNNIFFTCRLSESEFRQLVGNLDEVIEVHNTLHVALKEEVATNALQRVGKVLLNNGALVKAAHLTYWANHPKAVCVFEKYRNALDAFMEGRWRSKWFLHYIIIV